MRSLRRIAAAFGVAAMVVGAIAAPRVDAAEPSEASLSTFAQIRECVSNPESQLNVLYVVDESLSLRGSDPDGVRADVVANSLTQLGAISLKRTVVSAVATFADTYIMRRDWTELTPEVAAQEAQWASATLRTLNQGRATNWLDALQGAAATMQSSPRSRTACQVVVWMTDGAISMPGSDDTSADVDAMARICGADVLTGESLDVAPVIAQLRTAGVNVIGVLLNDGKADARQQAAMTYMLPIVEGEGTVDPSAFYEGSPAPFTYRCGQAPIPADQASGALVEAKDPLDLAFKFAGIAVLISGGTLVEPTGNRFEVEAGVGSFQVLIAGRNWSMTGPGGDPVITPTTDAPNIEVSASGPITTVEVSGAAVAQGEWIVTRADGDVDVFFFSGVELKWEPTEVFMDEPAKLSFTPVRDGMGLQELSAYQPTELTAKAAEAGGATAQLACTAEPGSARFTCDFMPTRVGVVRVEAQLPLTTLGGTQLQTVVLLTRVQVQAAQDYPQVREPADGTGIHQFGSLVGRRGAAQGSLVLVGPAKGDGSICFPDSSGIRITIDPQPDRIADYSFGGIPAGCVDLPQGSEATVSISITNPTSATGTVEGTFAVELRSSGRAGIASQEIVFAFSSERKADPPLLLLAILGAAALGLPLGLLYLQSWRAARLDLR